MSRSRFLSSTSVLVAVVLTQAGCPGDGETCGPGDAPAVGLAATGDQVTLTYGNFQAGLNNDCPDAAPPAGVISLTIQGSQTDGTGLLTFCVSRPDQLASRELSLGLDVVPSDIHVIDVDGTTTGCTYSLDRTVAPVGTGRSNGLCETGASDAGFAFDVDGTLSLVRICGDVTDAVQVTLAGRVAVAKE